MRTKHSVSPGSPGEGEIMARTFKYTPDDDIEVHEEGAIKLLCKPFQSHENGLPEWAKNSADEYARRDASEDARVIVLVFRDRTKTLPASVSCLDSAGMSTRVIESHFRRWADPEAASQGAMATGVQGGHGNGGKCYMTQMFDEYSMLHTVSGGKGNRYGVQGGSIRLGYIPNREKGRDFPVPDVSPELDAALRHTGLTLARLPDATQRVFAAAQGFTLVTGVGPKGYSNRIPVSRIVESLGEHPQMLQTLQLCRVYVLANGKVLNGGKPLSLPAIEPMKGGEEPRVIQIPSHLKDPVTSESISTTGAGKLPTGEIVLRTSQTSMRWSKKTRHSVVFEAQSGYIGYVRVPELDIQSPYRDRIYGLCRLEALEPFKQNDRGRLAESPLTRAAERFIAHSIQEYAKEFEYRDKKKYGQEEKDAISRINEALDKWKNRFLHSLMQGMWGDSEGGVGGGAPSLPKGVPSRVELLIPKPRLGRGVAVRPGLRFYNSEGKRIRPAPVEWHSDDPNVAAVDYLGIVNSFTYGTTTVFAETLDTGIRSNRLAVEVVRIHKVEISPREVEVGVGGRESLQAICTLQDGSTARDISLIWTEGNPTIARVSSSGMVYGFLAGEIEVTAGDDGVMAEAPAIIKVVEATPGGGKGKKRGRGFPRVLVSGEIDHDPDTDEYVNFSAEDPPVWQRPQDVERNIWWINSAAPLAKLYLDRSQGYGYDNREWRMYHLERLIDVIVQIAISHDPDEPGPLAASDWIMRWGSRVAGIQAAVASDLSGFIATGQLPGE